ncbi:MAG: efflux RND transporter periplasmic adaptor subunit [Terriglobales bacterium]
MPVNENGAGLLGTRRWLLWTMGVVAGVLLLASFMPHGETVPVRAARVERGTIRSLVSTNGKVEPVLNFEAHSPIGTTLTQLLVKEGDHVKKGQLLAQLDDASIRSQAAQAMAQLRTAEANGSAIRSGGNQEELLTLNAQLVKARTARDTAQHNLQALQSLQQQGASSSGEVRDATSQLARTEADVKLLEQKQKDRYSQPEIQQAAARQSEAQSAYAAAEDVLRQLNIRAPFDGVVYAIAPRQGAYLNAGDLVLQEADLSKVLVRAYVDEPDVGRLKIGEPIEITWDAVPGRVWQGTVSAVPATVKIQGTRNVGETTCVVSNADYKLLPNVNVGVTIVVGEHRDVLTLPREALRQDDQGAYVLQIQNNELHRRNVQTSITNLTHVEVASGLNDNDLVALNSTNSKPIQNGTVVKLVH